MQALWTVSPPTFSGRFVSFTGMVQRPLPTQRPHPPLVIGGNSVAPHPRAVRVGNGSYGWPLHLGETCAGLSAPRETACPRQGPPAPGDLARNRTPTRRRDRPTS